MINLITLTDKKDNKIALVGDRCYKDSDIVTITTIDGDTMRISDVDDVTVETVEYDDIRVDEALQMTAELVYRQNARDMQRMELAFALAEFN